MSYFEFSNNTIEKIKDELKRAEKFIKIAVFQLHREDIFNILLEKLKNQVEIEVFTLPYDSIHEDKEIIKKKFENLEKNGAKLHFCCWNVGDPSRTTTSVGQWYSFHGKFLLTDKCAIAMSANLTRDSELDAILIYKNDEDRIKEFNGKFQELKDLFIIKNLEYDGTIHKKIIDTGIENIEYVFELPNCIKTIIHKKHWIQHYPSEICPDLETIENKLYIIPFDCKGISLIKSILSQAKKFVYISTESFTDPNFPNFLKRISLKDLEIKILSGAKSMDFTDRIQNTFRELLAHNIKIKTRDDDLHAKLIITENHLVLSSINLNKINLGFEPKKNFWRENTETILVSSDELLIKEASHKFNEIFNQSMNIEEKLKERLGENVIKTIRSTFNIKSIKSDVKGIIAELILTKELETKKLVLDLGKFMAKITKHFEKSQLNMKCFLLSLILYFISKENLTLEQVKEKVELLDIEFEVEKLLNVLIKENFIQKIDDFYTYIK